MASTLAIRDGSAPTLNKPPKLPVGGGANPAADPNVIGAQPTASASPTAAPTSGQIQPSSIAAPPKAEQTATGGYGTAAQSDPTQMVQAAVRASVPKTGGATSGLGTSGRANDAGGLAGPPPSASVQSPRIPSATGGYTGAQPAAPPAAVPGANPNPLPIDPTDQNTIATANANYGNTAAAQNEAMYQAAMAYGDPTTMSQWGLPVTNPNSALALAALKAQQTTLADQNARGKNDTLFSSLAQTDLGNIASQQQRSDLAGYQTYQTALAKFNAAMTQALTNKQSAIGGAQANEVTNAQNNLPTADTATGGAATGTATNANTAPATGIKAPKTSKGAKVPKPPAIKTAKKK